MSPTHVLVLNSGSSSVKYQLLDMRDSSRLATGLVERIGEQTSRIKHTVAATGDTREQNGPIADHQAALKAVAEELARAGWASTRPSWPPSATAWCTAACSSASPPSSTTPCSPRSSD